jgi:endonuclease I
MSFKIFSALVAFVFTSNSFLAQIPPGYYDSASGLYGEELRTALSQIIDNHQVQNYSSLWFYFENTDVKENGKVWDMYSDNPFGAASYEYAFTADQCGTYNSEGDCFNREHSFPQSWFNQSSPMDSDMFHIYPTDAWVNNQRGNLPYGTTSQPNWTSSNGSKRGPNNSQGYTGTVFEPIDEYKGDFARSYFYMLTRYKNYVVNWDSPMLEGDYFSQWARELLVDWDINDPVSQKEIDRNNAIYAIQGNRNPYIDRPEYGQWVWDTAASLAEENSNSIKWWYANSTLNIGTVLESNCTMEIYNSLGGQIDIDLSDLSSGIYLGVFVENGKGVKVVKFLR